MGVAKAEEEFQLERGKEQKGDGKLQSCGSSGGISILLSLLGYVSARWEGGKSQSLE